MNVIASGAWQLITASEPRVILKSLPYIEGERALWLVEACVWLVVAGRVLMVDNLQGGAFLQEAFQIFALSVGRREVIDHLFLHCDAASYLWCHFLSIRDLQRCSTRSLCGMLRHESWLPLRIKLSYFGRSFTLLSFELFGRRGMRIEKVFNGILHQTRIS